MKYNSRKFLLCLLVILLASGLLYVGSLTAAVWGAAVGTALTVYCASNVAQKGVVNDKENV